MSIRIFLLKLIELADTADTHSPSVFAEKPGKPKMEPAGQTEAKMEPAADAGAERNRQAAGQGRKGSCVTPPYALPGFLGDFGPMGRRGENPG